jgi:Tfp pilus assembly protein PilO
MRTQVEQLKAQFRDFDRRLPRQQELAGFLREISGSARAGQFHGQVIEPGSPTAGALYDCLPIVMRFDCSFSDLASFLEGLGVMTRLSRVERLDVTEGHSPGLLHVQAQINIYFTES